jgi:hypothetical protein
VRGPLKLVFKSPALDILANRLRFGACGLNGCLQKLNRRDTELYDRCHVLEKVEHFLFGCSSEVTGALRDFCQLWAHAFSGGNSELTLGDSTHSQKAKETSLTVLRPSAGKETART